MAVETQERTETARRTIFSTREETEYKRPIFQNLSFDDTSLDVETHYQTDVQKINTVERRKVDMLTIDSEIKQHPEAPAKIRLNAHGKILISVIAICICALVAFMIGNAVTISALSNSVSAKQQVVYEQQQGVDALKAQYQSLEDAVVEKAMEAGMTETIVNPTEVSTVEKMVKPQAKIESNWFDAICNFFASIFA